MVLFSIITIAKKQGNFAAILQYHPTAGEKYTSADLLAHSGIITMKKAKGTPQKPFWGRFQYLLSIPCFLTPENVSM